MGAPLALLICSVGIAGLFYLDRDSSIRNSKALWLPVMWLWIVGSRPVSVWLGIGGSSGDTLASTLDGSPMDAAIFTALIVVGVIVVFIRRDRTIALLKASGPVILFFVYCLMSVTWSPFPEPAFKRWTKAVGDLVMVLIIATDGQPIAALRRVYSRVGFLLFPLSVVLIRYTDLGRRYDPDGNPMNVGVTTNKNELGLIVFIITLGVLWSVRELLINKETPHRGRHLVAQCTLLAFGSALLEMAHSATSTTCFILGGGLMLATSLQAIRKRPSRVRALCFVVVLAGGLGMLFGGQSAFSNALGRGDGMSGRTYIWAAAIGAAGNPVIGTGFESFWNANAHKVNRSLHLAGFINMSNLNSAHNGYLEVYLDLGYLGVGLVVLILISAYRNTTRAFQQDPELGGLMLAYVTTATFYSITEAGFRVLTPSWIFLLLAVVGTSRPSAGLLAGDAPKTPASPSGEVNRAYGDNKLVPNREAVYTARRGSTQNGGRLPGVDTKGVLSRTPDN